MESLVKAIVLVALSCFLFMWFKARSVRHGHPPLFLLLQEKQGRSVKGNDQLDVQGCLFSLSKEPAASRLYLLQDSYFWQAPHPLVDSWDGLGHPT